MILSLLLVLDLLNCDMVRSELPLLVELLMLLVLVGEGGVAAGMRNRSFSVIKLIVVRGSGLKDM